MAEKSEYPLASLLVRLDPGAARRWSGALPVEIRDATKLVLRAKGVCDKELPVPAGRYLVTATLPNGQVVTLDEIVELKPGDIRQVSLSTGNLELPESLKYSKTFGDSVREFVRPVTDLFSSHTIAVLRGNWLPQRIDAHASITVRREPTTRTNIAITFSPTHIWIEIAGSADATYMAVPVDENRSTIVQWTIKPPGDQIELKFDFGEGELNSFYDFIQNDQAVGARTIGQSIVARSEQYIADKQRSPLLAILGAYVLLRANELEGMDVWTDNLVRWFTWLPDALAIRVEFLARQGQHEQAVRLLLDAGAWGTPWFRSGIGYLESRAKLYANVANRKRSSLTLSDADLRTLQRVAAVFGELVSRLDMSHATTVLRAMPKIP